VKARHYELKRKVATEKLALEESRAANIDAKTSLGKRKREDYGPEEIRRIAEYLSMEVVKRRKTDEA
jgi:hypothetical protein